MKPFKSPIANGLVVIGIGLVWALVTEFALSTIPSFVAPHPISGYFWDNFATLWALWSIFWLLFVYIDSKYP